MHTKCWAVLKVTIFSIYVPVSLSLSLSLSAPAWPFPRCPLASGGAALPSAARRPCVGATPGVLGVWVRDRERGERKRGEREKIGHEPLALHAPLHTLGYIVGE